MSGTLTGDPAGCSRAGGTLARTAAGLRLDGDRVRDALAGVDEHWRGRASVTVRRRAAELARALEETADELSATGHRLQEHATELADALAAQRRLGERADRVGLVLEDGRVTRRWGVAGEADAAAEAAGDRAVDELQAVLDSLVVQVARRRRRLAATLEESARALAATGGRLRR